MNDEIKLLPCKAGRYPARVTIDDTIPDWLYSTSRRLKRVPTTLPMPVGPVLWTVGTYSFDNEIYLMNVDTYNNLVITCKAELEE